MDERIITVSQNGHGPNNKCVKHLYAHGWYHGHWLISPPLKGQIRRLPNVVYAPSASMRESIESTTSFFHMSMVVNPGSDDHLRIRKFIHKGLLSSESPESWIPSHSSLQPYVKYFCKFVTYYMFDHNYNINTRDIRRQLVGYIMSMKRKWGSKLEAKEWAEGRYHCMFKNLSE